MIQYIKDTLKQQPMRCDTIHPDNDAVPSDFVLTQHNVIQCNTMQWGGGVHDAMQFNIV